jgi:hypothetical protein
MKKIIRMTESDLTNLVKRVIEEQTKPSSAPKKVDYEGLQYFFMKMNQGGTNNYQRWVLDPSNPRKGGDNLVLTGKEVIMPTSLVNKPLVWSLLKQGKKEPDAIFEFFKGNDGVIYWNCISDRFALCQTDDGETSPCRNQTYQTLTSKNAQAAVNAFNSRVQIKEVTQ